MQMALEEMTLVVFTTLAPAGIVATVLLACVLVCTPAGERAARLSRHLVIPLGVAVVGLVASAAHLGTPANVLYVITGVGRSPLSNEVAAAVVFFVVGGIYWIASFAWEPPAVFARVWLAVLVVAGAAALVSIAYAYAVPTIPTWNMAQVPFALAAGGIACGPVLALFTMLVARVFPSTRLWHLLFAIAIVGAVAGAITFASEYAALPGMRTTAHRAVELVPFWLPALASFAVLEAAALVLMLGACKKLPDARIAKRGYRVVLLRLGAATLLGLLACFAMRFCFYSMCMTIGV